MSFLQQIRKGTIGKARRTVLFGSHGVGKSTWASGWPDALFIPTEDGCNDIEVAKGPLCKTYEETMTAIKEVQNAVANCPYRTIILDSADWLERQIHDKLVCETMGAEAINDGKLGFGKGYVQAISLLTPVMNAMNVIRDHGIHIVVLAHCEVKRQEPPDGDSYDKYVPKMQDRFGGVLQEWADEVLFMRTRIYTTEKDEGFNRTRRVAQGSGERVIMTSERPGWLAKNRIPGLPDEVDVGDGSDPTADWMHYGQYLPKIEVANAA